MASYDVFQAVHKARMDCGLRHQHLYRINVTQKAERGYALLGRAVVDAPDQWEVRIHPDDWNAWIDTNGHRVFGCVPDFILGLPIWFDADPTPWLSLAVVENGPHDQQLQVYRDDQLLGVVKGVTHINWDMPVKDLSNLTINVNVERAKIDARQ